mmetsp:Transcript_28022/g.54891  ORF Transcript_28022/g.54891 Transcript_28022/m.54891 type:complete len:231 (-) Transcript_28022:140-832(-)
MKLPGYLNDVVVRTVLGRYHHRTVFTLLHLPPDQNGKVTLLADSHQTVDLPALGIQHSSGWTEGPNPVIVVCFGDEPEQRVVGRHEAPELLSAHSGNQFLLTEVEVHLVLAYIIDVPALPQIPWRPSNRILPAPPTGRGGPLPCLHTAPTTHLRHVPSQGPRRSRGRRRAFLCSSFPPFLFHLLNSPGRNIGTPRARLGEGVQRPGGGGGRGGGLGAVIRQICPRAPDLG